MSPRIEDLRSFGVNQIQAAPDTFLALAELPSITTDAALIAVKETDIFRLRRGLCLPSATATCINALFGKKIIGEVHEESELTIGDIFRVILPFNNRSNLVNENGQVYPHPWFVVTKQGDMYHQAALAVAQGCDAKAAALTNIESVKDLKPFMLKGGKVALSLDNRFVLKHTLQNDPTLVSYVADQAHIRVETKDGVKFTKFEEGRHVVSLIGMEDEEFFVHDSFCLPQMPVINSLMRLSATTLDPYLQYKTGGTSRGIGFALNTEQLEELKGKVNQNIFIPRDVVTAITRMRTNSLTYGTKLYS